MLYSKSGLLLISSNSRCISLTEIGYPIEINFISLTTPLTSSKLVVSFMIFFKKNSPPNGCLKLT